MTAFPMLTVQKIEPPQSVSSLMMTRGLIPLLKHYKFTVEENTPIEQDVALDPELLGKVFENLLAAYNRETATTVRKQTGVLLHPACRCGLYGGGGVGSDVGATSVTNGRRCEVVGGGVTLSV